MFRVELFIKFIDKALTQQVNQIHFLHCWVLNSTAAYFPCALSSSKCGVVQLLILLRCVCMQEIAS